jgi:hypothetical protein
VVRPPLSRPPVEHLADGAVRVPLTKGKFALIDAADWPEIGKYSWCAVLKSGGRWYAYRGRRKSDTFTTSLIAMHTQLTGWPEVDHRSRDGLDNRRANLRPASRSENNGNHVIRSDSRNQYKGVYMRTNGTWTAACKGTHLGTFKTEEAAALAYDAEALRVFGQYARINFPEGR